MGEIMKGLIRSKFEINIQLSSLFSLLDMDPLR